MKTVIYRGAADPRDRTSRYRHGNLTFPKGKEITDVPDDVASELEATEGHEFEVSSGKKASGKKASGDKNPDPAETAQTKE